MMLQDAAPASSEPRERSPRRLARPSLATMSAGALERGGGLVLHGAEAGGEIAPLPVRALERLARRREHVDQRLVADLGLAEIGDRVLAGAERARERAGIERIPILDDVADLEEERSVERAHRAADLVEQRVADHAAGLGERGLAPVEALDHHAEALAHVDAVITVAGRAVDLGELVLGGDDRARDVDRDRAGAGERNGVGHVSSPPRRPRGRSNARAPRAGGRVPRRGGSPSPTRPSSRAR